MQSLNQLQGPFLGTCELSCQKEKDGTRIPNLHAIAVMSPVRPGTNDVTRTR
jgi:hypothetical protein